jgi:predicted SAM-dependent methyltransferase
VIQRVARSVGRAIAGAVATVAAPRMSRSLRTALLNVRFELYMQRLHRASVKRAASLTNGKPLRLNLGSGFHPKPGWINVDLVDELSDLQLDLREPLPFADNSVAQIYTEHFFEHLSFTSPADSLAREIEAPGSPSDALTFLRECLRVLAPGGTIDIGVPDAEIALHDYLQRQTAGGDGHGANANWWGPNWCDTPMHRLNYVFRQGREHQYAWDYETLERVLAAVGFTSIAAAVRSGARPPQSNPLALRARGKTAREQLGM